MVPFFESFSSSNSYFHHFPIILSNRKFHFLFSFELRVFGTCIQEIRPETVIDDLRDAKAKLKGFALKKVFSSKEPCKNSNRENLNIKLKTTLRFSSL